MLPDLLARNLALVVCGTGAGRRSAEVGRYDAGPGNRFWRTLFAVGLTPTELGPEDAEHLLMLGIGLTDVVKDSAGSDRDLPFSLADTMALRMKILANRPWYLCFNGKRAAQEFLRSTHVEYGVHGRLGRTTLFVAPSTSRAANGSWDLTPWKDLARRVRRPRRTNQARLCAE
jgi:TDG/mug DNA glycosylase family protein